MNKKKLNTRKMVLCAILASLAFVLNTFVYFPAMAPFQHFVDVIAAVFLGPWWACLSAFLCGVMRMMSGRTIQAVTGAVFGPILGGLLWRRTKNVRFATAPYHLFNIRFSPIPFPNQRIIPARHCAAI